MSANLLRGSKGEKRTKHRASCEKCAAFSRSSGCENDVETSAVRESEPIPSWKDRVGNGTRRRFTTEPGIVDRDGPVLDASRVGR